MYAFIHYRTVGVKLNTLTLVKSLPSRGVFAIVVILHHLSYRVNTPPQFLFVPLGAMAVGVFFLMSGYGLEYSYNTKGDKYLDGFLKKRVLKLLLPYLAAVVAWNVEELLLYPQESLLDAWLLVKNGDTNGILPYCWYVIVAMLFYVMFWLSHRWLKSEENRFLAIAVFWLAWCMVTCLLNWGNEWFFTSHMFLVGILYYKAERMIKRCNAYAWMAVTLMMAVLGTTVHFYFFSSMLFNTAFSLLIVCGITLLEYRSKVLDFLGKISYEMYIVQAMPLFALKDSGLPPFVIAALCVCIDIVLAYALNISIGKLTKRIA